MYSPMTNSTTSSNIFCLLKALSAILFWVVVWEIAALAVGNDFLLPSVPATAEELILLLRSPASYKVMLLTLLRVGLGLILGIILGTLLGVLCRKSSVLESLVSPAVSVIKSTPVASFIIFLWVIMNGDLLSVFIAFLMVLPIIYQNVINAYSSIDKDLSEVCDVFKFNRIKRFKLLVFPTLTSFLVPAIITSAGLAWKAEIAAEIIAYTKNSIGQRINDAKYDMNTPRVFAWTVIVIVFSLILEKVTKMLLGRLKYVNNH